MPGGSNRPPDHSRRLRKVGKMKRPNSKLGRRDLVNSAADGQRPGGEKNRDQGWSGGTKTSKEGTRRKIRKFSSTA